MGRKPLGVMPADSGREVMALLEVRYVNLNRRPDRRSQVEEELRKVAAVSPVRFSAVDGALSRGTEQSANDSASLGCALSHREVLRFAGTSAEAVMVCEDDLYFSGSRAEIWATIGDFLGDPRLDVLCLSYNIGDVPIRVHPRLLISQDISTTACYIVKQHAVEILKESFDTSVQLFLAGERVQVASIDQYWKRLQRRKLIFCIPDGRLALQRESFSDITGAMEDRGV